MADEDDEKTVPMLLKQAEEKLLNELTLKGFPEIQKLLTQKKQIRVTRNIMIQLLEQTQLKRIIELSRF